MAKIRVRGPGGFESIVGTGFIVDAGLVLTARHVVKRLASADDETGAHRRNAEHWHEFDDYPTDMLRACPAEGARGVEVTALLDLGPTLDVVCLVVPGLPSPDSPSTAARHVGTVPLENCWMIGYPQAATDDGSVQAEYVGARLIPVSRNTDGLLALDITTAQPTQREGWKGASGAGATDASGNLLGIISHVPAQLEGRLLAVGISEIVSAARIFRDANMDRTQERQRALAALAAIEVVENPVLPEAEEGAVAALTHRLLDAITPILPQSAAFAIQRAHGGISNGRFSKALLAFEVVVMVALLFAVMVNWNGVPQSTAQTQSTAEPETSNAPETPPIEDAPSIEQLFTEGNCLSLDLSKFEEFAGQPISDEPSARTWSLDSETTGSLLCDYSISYNNDPHWDRVDLSLEVAVYEDSATAEGYQQHIAADNEPEDGTVLSLEVTDFNGSIIEYEHFLDTDTGYDEDVIIHEIEIIASRDNILLVADMGLEVGVHDDINAGREVLMSLIEQAYSMCGYYVVE